VPAFCRASSWMFPIGNAALLILEKRLPVKPKADAKQAYRRSRRGHWWDQGEIAVNGNSSDMCLNKKTPAARERPASNGTGRHGR